MISSLLKKTQNTINYVVAEMHCEKAMLLTGDDAIKQYQQAIALNPNSPNAYFYMGTILNTQGKNDEAMIAYQKVIELKPNHAQAYIGIGNMFRAQAKLEEAVEAYKQAIEVSPCELVAYNNMRVTLNDQGKYEEAIEVYKKSLDSNLSSVSSHKNSEHSPIHTKKQSDEERSLLQSAVDTDSETEFYSEYSPFGSERAADRIAQTLIGDAGFLEN